MISDHKILYVELFLGGGGIYETFNYRHLSTTLTLSH